MRLKSHLFIIALLLSTKAWPQLIANEIMVSNLDVCLDPSFNYGGWVELCNTGTQDINLHDIYISDDEANLFRFRLPATAGTIPSNGFGCIWFDHYEASSAPTQVPFKLDAEGGTIYLSNNLGQILLTIDYPAGMPRCSWARTEDITGEWEWTAFPSPAASNNTSAFCSERADAPTLNKESTLFEDSMTVSLSWPNEYTIRYTTDGSIPTETNGSILQSHSIMISSTTVFRFRAFCEGMLPSKVVTRSYILREHDYKIPVLSVVANDEDLYGTDHGLFAKGPNGRAGRGESDLCNWNMEWERAANAELIDPIGGMVINQEVDIAPSGGSSRSWSPTPFKLIASDLYGSNNYFDYAVFDRKPYIRNKCIKARNGGNDWYDRFRDPALQMIVGRSGLNIDYQEYQPVQHYVNGIYKGVINLREPNNKHFVRANHGWDDDEIDMFEMDINLGYTQMYGDRDTFDQWCSLASRCADDEAAYDELASMVDVEEMAYYLATELYLANGDWPYNNIKAFRPRIEGGKWRFVVYDLDGCLSISDVFNHFEKYKKHPIVQLTLDMLKNERFCKLFTDAFCVVAGSVFEPTRCLAIADEINNMTWSEINYEGKTPSYSYNLIKSSLTSQRQTSMVDEMYSYLNLSDHQRMTVNASITTLGTEDGGEECGRLLYNDLPIPTGKLSGKVVAPVTLRAEPVSSHEFIEWRMVGNDFDKTFIPKSSNWLYYDKGSLDGTGWYSPSYDDSSWKIGAAPLGYSATNKGFGTLLDYSNATNRRPTYYMRTKVNMGSTTNSTITLSYASDDGFVLYVNGKEALRNRMPNGTPSYETYASSKSMGNPDKNKITLDAALFTPGENTIAVELHNYKPDDNDVYWDASLTASSHYTDDELILSTESELTLTEGVDIDVVAVFGKRQDASRSFMPLRINEVSANNDIYANDYWKRNDWIELYNTSDEDVDLTGMYLSDNISNPIKYQIPAASEAVSNIVPAHGYKVVWCDKQDPITQMHASFKLSADSGYVVLTHSAGILADTLRYCSQDRDMTVGRYPDGGDNVYTMNCPTIGKANVITLCDSQHEQLHITPDGIHKVDIPEPSVVDVQYVTPEGVIVQQPTSGIYILRETLSDSSVRTKKVFRK